VALYKHDLIDLFILTFLMRLFRFVKPTLRKSLCTVMIIIIIIIMPELYYR